MNSPRAARESLVVSEEQIVRAVERIHAGRRAANTPPEDASSASK